MSTSNELEKQCTHLVFSTKETPTLKEVMDKLTKGSELEKV